MRNSNTTNTATTAIIMDRAQLSNVAKNDIAAAMPSIKLSALGVPATVTVNDTTADTAQQKAPEPSGIKGIEHLVNEREEWESTIYRASNDVLYVLLQKCYTLYKRMEGTSVEAVTLRANLTDYISRKGIKCVPSSHTIVKIVKCVFGDDRRRASAYGIVLRAALAEKIAAADIPDYIRTKGGVEEIRLSKSPNAMTPKQKAAVAANAFKADEMGVFASERLGEKFDAGKTGAAVVLIGTWQADGSVVVRSVAQSDAAVNAALASYYSANKDVVQKQAAQEKAADEQQLRQFAVTAAAQTAVVNS